MKFLDLTQDPPNGSPSEDTLFEISCVLNDTTTWKVKRAVLKHKFGLDDYTIEDLVPEPECDF